MVEKSPASWASLRLDESPLMFFLQTATHQAMNIAQLETDWEKLATRLPTIRHDRNHFNMAFFKTWKCRCLQIHHGHLKKTIFLNKELPYPIHRAATLVANVADPSCLKFSIKVKAFRTYSDIFCVAVHVFLATLCSPQGCLQTIHFKSWQHSFMGSWCTSFLRKIWL